MSTTSQLPEETLLTLTANAVRKAVAGGVAPSEGFLIVDLSMNPVYVSQEVAQILLYPQKVQKEKNLGNYLTKKLRSLQFLEQSSGPSTNVVAKLQSGRRQYLCRAFHLNGFEQGDSQALVALLLERAVVKSLPLATISERFRLTTREREVAQHLLEGLTSKEIGIRMKISPHTVKAFIRLIMFKMGVSTRSGIVGKAFTIEP
jgi:DNA-binding CsgD family transcriptional regulator